MLVINISVRMSKVQGMISEVVINETYLGAIKQSAVGIIEEANTGDDEDRNVLISHFVDGIRR